MTFFVEIIKSWNSAQCVSEMVDTMAKGDIRGVINLGLGGMSASVLVSDVNGTTPIEIDTFRVQAEASQSGRLEGQADDRVPRLR